MFGGGESFKNFYTKQSNGRFLGQGRRVRLGQGALQRGALRLEQLLDSSTYWPFVRDTANAWYNAQVAAGKTPERSRPTWRSSTRSTATTTTTTASSPSPTATSTTSRRSTPVRARRPVAAPRAPTRSGRTAGRPTPTTGRDRPGLQQGRRRPARRLRHLDRRLHHRAGERRPRRLRARVRPRPRSARPLRHRRWRQRHRLLDPDERRLVAQPRHRLHRHHARLHGPVGEAAARLARLQGGQLRRGHLGQAQPGRPRAPRPGPPRP